MYPPLGITRRNKTRPVASLLTIINDMHIVERYGRDLNSYFGLKIIDNLLEVYLTIGDLKLSSITHCSPMSGITLNHLTHAIERFKSGDTVPRPKAPTPTSVKVKEKKTYQWTAKRKAILSMLGTKTKTQRAIAREFGVAPSQVSYLKEKAYAQRFLDEHGLTPLGKELLRQT